jgi:hypothetical protein
MIAVVRSNVLHHCNHASSTEFNIRQRQFWISRTLHCCIHEAPTTVQFFHNIAMRRQGKSPYPEHQLMMDTYVTVTACNQLQRIESSHAGMKMCVLGCK